MQVKIFDPIHELEKLEDKVAAKYKEGKVCPSETLVAKAALKEVGWDPTLIKEAIERGQAKARGEELDPPSWWSLEVSRASELQRDTAAEEDEETSGRLPSMRINLLETEPDEQEEVYPDRPHIPEGVDRPQDFDTVWDCPVCNLVVSIGDDVCPHCGLDREAIELKVSQLYMEPDNSSMNPAEHVRYLNSLIMMKTKNKRWDNLVLAYMKKYGLKPEDMEGLFGPKPWEEEMEAEVQEKTSTNEELAAALQGMKKAKEDVITNLQKALQTRGDQKANQAEASMADIRSALEEKAAEVEDTDKRARVIVGDEVGWHCTGCNRVWSLEHEKCIICDPEYRKKLEETEKREASKVEEKKSDLEVLKEKLTALKGETEEFKGCGKTLGHGETCCKGHLCACCESKSPEERAFEMDAEEAVKQDLYNEVKNMQGMDAKEKLRLMLLLKNKEKDAKGPETDTVRKPDSDSEL